MTWIKEFIKAWLHYPEFQRRAKQLCKKPISRLRYSLLNAEYSGEK